MSNEVRSADTLNYDAGGNVLGPSGSGATQSYGEHDTEGGCYGRTLTAQAQKPIAAQDGADCQSGPR